MRSRFQIISGSLTLTLCCANALAHDDMVAREKEFRYGYQVGYITAIRDAHEGSLMCTKDVSLLEAIQTIGAYGKAKGVTSDKVFSAKNITEALSAKYKCSAK